MNRTLRWIVGPASVFGLIAIRFFEENLFFDPLHNFYHGNYLTIEEAPEFNFFNSLLSITFRYCLNSLFSLLILYCAFRSKTVMRFSFWFYGICFLLLIIIFAITAFEIQPGEFMTVFYIRRFLIQPLFIILLLPAFYYQKKMSSGRK